MKGLQQRFRERQKTQQGRRTAPAMETYAEALRTVSGSTCGRSYRQGDGALVQRLKPGVVYAVKTPDSDVYYRTVLLKTTDNHCSKVLNGLVTKQNGTLKYHNIKLRVRSG